MLNILEHILTMFVYPAVDQMNLISLVKNVEKKRRVQHLPDSRL